MATRNSREITFLRRRRDRQGLKHRAQKPQKNREKLDKVQKII
jgi:hypothetical protein